VIEAGLGDSSRNAKWSPPDGFSMPIELQCGACSGVFLADQPGTIVACPHCGGHLQVPHQEDGGGTVDAPADDASPENPAPASVESMTETTGSPSMPTLPPAPLTRDPSTDLLPDQQPKLEEPPTEVIPQAEVERRLAEASAPGQPTWTEMATQIGTSPLVEMPTMAGQPASTAAGPGAGRLEETAPFFTLGPPPSPKPPAPVEYVRSAPSLPAAAPADDAPLSSTPPVETVPKAWFHLALSVASALAITTLYLGWTVYKQTWTVHQLESLPDKAPPKPRSGDKNAKITLIRVPFEAAMPRRHTLRVGDTERYGNLRLSVLGVTRGPVTFTHFNADEKTVRPPTAPVLKLRLKVENVGDEAFTPFDHELVYDREPDPKNNDFLWANNFVCIIANKKKTGTRALMYDLPAGSSWDLAGQNCGRELAPAESVETYLATEESNIEELTGDLIWRVHFRKGHNKRTGRGVTTLIEVAFRDDQIEPDPVAATPAPTAAPTNPAAPATPNPASKTG
jgi:hypothetical protein